MAIPLDIGAADPWGVARQVFRIIMRPNPN
jgi:hypothetical protein